MRVAKSIVTIAALTQLLCAQGDPRAGNASLAGRVTNSVTGAGIAGAHVQVWITGDAMRPAVADGTGAFRIEGLPEGQYKMSCASDGFIGADAIQPTPLIRVSGDARSDCPLTPKASVRGRVLDPEGKPAAGIAVKLGSYDAVTDEKGEYAFEGVLPFLSFSLSAAPKPQPDSKEGERIVTTYYPSAIDSSQATQIKVEGVDLLGYDIRLQTARARAIRGVVIDLDGKPAAHATVSIYKPALGAVTIVTMARGGTINAGPPSTAAAQSIETAEDGTFVFSSVLEGDWRVRALLRSEETGARSGAAEVRVSDRDLDNLELRLAPPFEVQVSAEAGDPPSAVPAAPLMVVPLDGQQAAVSNVKESHVLKGYAGRVIMKPAATPGFYAAAVMLENRDVLGQAVELSGPGSLKLIYKSDGGTVRGTVEKGAGAIVALMAQETPAARLGYGAFCNADGAFSIGDVPPGEYTVVAISKVEVLVGPEFPNVLASSGKRVQVEAGATAPLELRLARLP